MKFLAKKRRHPPAIIIVSLIDILVVILIFLFVTTTFKKQPSLKLALPESKQATAGSSETAPLVITVDKNPPYLYVEKLPITLEGLQKELVKRAKSDPKLTIAIRPDESAPIGLIVKVMDAAKAANVHVASLYTRASTSK